MILPSSSASTTRSFSSRISPRTDAEPHAVNQLAPGGGTALWDAVGFAADKLASHPEIQPVARMLVVISDGEDNSSSITLKAGHREGSTRRSRRLHRQYPRRLEGRAGRRARDHALRALSELTGGTAFMPGSLRHLSGSLADLQQVIRGRYLVSYKPASFQPDGRTEPSTCGPERRPQADSIRPKRLLRFSSQPIR